MAISPHCPYIILAGRHLTLLGKQLGYSVTFGIFEDPNPLGVEAQEVLQALPERDEAAKATSNFSFSKTAI